MNHYHVGLFIVVLATVLGVVMPIDRIQNNITLYQNMDHIRNDKNTLVVIPILTANAYKDGAFYDYYNGICDESCLITPINQGIRLQEQSNANTINTLEKTGYGFMNDYIIDYRLSIDPNFLLYYDRLVILHSEYVTDRLYKAFNEHPNVIYLAPNANYALVSVEKAKMKLVAGHGYMGKSNAFDWEYENTVNEHDKECVDWQFNKIRNGYQLNCNPELTIHTNIELLKTLKDL